jgi:hypothetical protein
MNRRELVDKVSHLDPDKPCVPVAALPGLCDAFELRQMVKAAVAQMLTQFRAASTLDDQPPREQVDALYALGQLLVYTQWPEIQRQMDAAVDARNRTAATSGD